MQNMQWGPHYAMLYCESSRIASVIHMISKLFSRSPENRTVFPARAKLVLSCKTWRYLIKNAHLCVALYTNTHFSVLPSIYNLWSYHGDCVQQ